MAPMTGTLYIIATPIGNLADISLRAIEILKKVDLIAAEDTRHSLVLLKHYGINTPCISLHKFNENKKSSYLIEELQQGKNIALISDAGTPLVSDPGFHLVKAVRDAGIPIITIPGPCAAIAALAASGLATDKFIFEGFLPVKKTAQCERLEELKNETRTIILYEAPHRLLQLVDNLLEIIGAERQIVIAKELTKIHETIIAAPIPEVKAWLLADPKRQLGEFVILIQGAIEQKDMTISADTRKVLAILLQELPTKKAVNITAKITNCDKRELYQLAISSLQNH
ncbi:MAG: 16S rRNA (cytidine(1402)-2'-O)-methyltransferase [Gammaproteobacteria bacterium]|nr:16S rRNA (cytidine(1402)-2'-O)-methyltransferase [Gammaproteobacteria bacterium]